MKPISTSATQTLKGLNGLRFIAACLVVNGHSKLISQQLANYNSNPMWNFFYCNATNAVTFFFVLSGFLITYLLLIEWEKNETISIKKFYAKRLLRIFPLYYLILMATGVIIPLLFFVLQKNVITYQVPQLVLYFLFLPNFVGMIGKLSHLWSIGVEEQFYLLWAPLVKYCKKYLLPIIILFIISKWMIEIFIPHKTFLFENVSMHTMLIHFITTFQIHYMAFGALGGYLLVYHPEIIKNKILMSKASQLIIFILIALKFSTAQNIFTEQFPIMKILCSVHFDALFLPFLFLLIILNVSLNTKSILKLHNKIWDYLGDLSFGVYMFHLPLIYVIKPLFKSLTNISQCNSSYILYSILVYLITIFCAAISFHFFESRFKKFRPK